jgi:hypothetical protein
MAGWLSDEQRAALMERKSFRKEELSAFSPTEMEAVETAFEARGGDVSFFGQLSSQDRQLAETSIEIDFSNLELNRFFDVASFPTDPSDFGQSFPTVTARPLRDLGGQQGA